MPVVVPFGGVVGRDLDHRPVVVPGPFSCRAGAHPLPHAGFHHTGGVLHGDAAAGGQGDHVIGADGQDVSGAALADPLAQVKAAVHLVAGDEPGADAPVVRVLEQVTGQLRFCREHDVVGDSGQLAALLVGGPVLGQVQGPADQGVPGRGRDGEGDRDLAHRDPAEGAAVLAGRARAVRRGLGVAGLVHDQHHVSGVLACAKAPGGPVRGGIEHPLVINAGTGQQVLHPVRAGVPGGLGHGPAVVIVEFREHSVHHVTAGQAGLPAGEARRGPRHQVIEQAVRRGIVYAGASGCRLIVLFHKLA